MSELSLNELEAQHGELLPEREALGRMGCYHFGSHDHDPHGHDPHGHDHDPHGDDGCDSRDHGWSRDDWQMPGFDWFAG